LGRSETVVDYRVQDSQAWLNRTYGDLIGWEALDEDGITGWQTIYGLRRALQVELGVFPLGTAFGDTTRAAFVEHVGRINATVVDRNLLMILSCSLWCKGVAGLGPDYYASGGPAPSFAAMESSVGYLWGALGLGTSAAPYVDVKMMVWLLSMDTYRLLAGGTTTVQGVQRWLNGAYATRPGVAMVAADGVFTRPMQQALMVAVQLEIGFSDDEANGVFGPQTQGRLSGDPEYPYYRGPYFPHLFQALLTVNGYPLVVDGDIGAGTLRAAGKFRYFMGLASSDGPASSSVLGHYGTWAALLVSCGDPDRAVTGFDHRFQLPQAALQDARNQGYRVVGRYTVGTTTDENGVTLDKFVDREEIQAMKAVGMDLLPIHQRMENSVSWMTYDYGYIRGTEATHRAHVLGLPANSIVYFAVDFDAYGATVDGPVRDFFRGINDAVDEVAQTYPMRVGVYGARNVCDRVVSSGLAVSAFVAGITYGWSGNMGFPMPSSWRYNQIKETTLTLGGAVRHVDKFDVARNAEPVPISQITGPPPERDGRDSATGFSVDFEWFIEAVHKVEGNFAASAIGNEYRSEAANYALQAIQFLGYRTPPWLVFTPYGNERALGSAVTAITEVDLGPFKELRDAHHFGAVARSHLIRGVLPSSSGGWTLGDLGGWGLDLYSVWGAFLSAQSADPSLPGDPDTVYSFVRDAVGSADPSSKFSSLDLVADADGFLIAHSIDNGSSYIGAFRDLCEMSASERISEFYRARFGGTESGVSAAFTQMVQAHDSAIVHDAFGIAYNNVCNMPVDAPRPSSVQMRAIAAAFATDLSAHA
jgi:peptidoglycan hydrolase-like protein with peptidoglycan-binding domain